MVRLPICCALVLLASAGAAPPGGPTRIRARRRAPTTRRGIQLAEQGLYAAALEQFKSAYEKSPHFAVLYNIGQAQMALGRPLEAIEALTRYVRDGADQVPLSRREQVQAQIALLESPARGAFGHHRSVGRAGDRRRARGRPDAALSADPAGRRDAHGVDHDGGHHSDHQAIDLREGDRQALAFVVPPAVAPKPAAAAELPAASVVATPPPAPPPRDLRKWSYVTAGVGAAAGAAALGSTSGTGAATTTGRRPTRRCRRSRRAAPPTTRPPPRTTRAPIRSRPRTTRSSVFRSRAAF